MAFITNVIRRQWTLFSLPTTHRLRGMRKVLFGLSLIIFTSNLAPIVIDILTIFSTTDRPPTVSAVSLSYALSSNLPALLSSILIWLLYRMAEQALRDTYFVEHPEDSEDL